MVGALVAVFSGDPLRAWVLFAVSALAFGLLSLAILGDRAGRDMISTPVLKQIGDLKPQDFREHPIWVHVHTLDCDEEWYDGTDEETVRPWIGDRPVGTDEIYLVSARFRFADATEFPGLVTPTDGPDGIDSMGHLQPRMFAPSGERFDFWHGMFRRQEDERRFYEQLQKAPAQVFPIEFEALPGLTSALASGVVPGFLSIPAGHRVVVSK